MEASNANLKRQRVRRQREIYQKTQRLTWFGQSTYVHKGDEKSTINMRVQNTMRNNLTNSLRIHGRFTQVITYQACDP